MCNTKDVFAFISMAACQTKEKGAFELSLKDAVAFMSANSTVDFVVCQQEFVGKIVFSKVQFLDSGLLCVTVQTIFVRKALLVRPRDQKALAFLARRVVTSAFR